MEEKIKVTQATHQVLTERVNRLTMELNQFQVDNRTSKSEDAPQEISREGDLQAALRTAKNQLKNCVIVPVPSHNRTVQIGHQVTILMNGIPKNFLFDGLSADKRTLSSNSPLGKKLLGSTIGTKIFLNSQIIDVIEIFK